MTTEIALIGVNKIKPSPMQPRQEFDEESLNELVESLKEIGLLCPVILKRDGNQYQLIAGERRWTAAKKAGFKEILAIIKDDVTNFEMLLESIAENIHRKDLTSVERENAIYELWKIGTENKELKTKTELAKKLGLDQSTVSHIIQAKEFRDKVGLTSEISTSSITYTSGLPEKERVQILERVESGEIKAGEVLEYTRAIKESSEPVRRALLKKGSKLTLEEARLIEIQSETEAEKKLLVGKLEQERARDITTLINYFKEPLEIEEPSTQLSIITDEYTLLDGSQKLLVKRVGTGSIIERFEKTPTPQEAADVVCPHFLELKWGLGCKYRCSWCYLQGTLRFQEDKMKPEIKDFDKIEMHVKRFLEITNPPEILNAGELADSLMWEDGESVQTPFTRFIIPLFEKQDRHKVLFLTKSDKVENLLDIPPHNQVIMSFTLNAYEVAKQWEKGAPPVENRIEAARKVKEAGYETRIRIDPLVPVIDWKSKYIELIDQIFATFEPERITLGSLRGLQSTINEAKDKSWVKFLSETSSWGKKIDFSTRYKMYSTLISYLKDKHKYTNIALCKETLGMWAKLGLDYTKIKCNCVC